MPSRDEVNYFGAGPAPLPTAVLEECARALVNFNNTGLSLAEISHRSPTANKVIADTKDALSTLLDIPTDTYEILFLQGGGSGEFSAVVQNLVSAWVERRRRRARVRREIETELRVDYLVTGSWSLKASQEAARLIGSRYVNVALDTRKAGGANGKAFTSIPQDDKLWAGQLTTPRRNAAFVYFCDNETVDGVEFPSFPAALEGGNEETVVVADMSSNFLSRRVDVNKYGVIFAGAQKNLGIPGITLAIVRKSLLTLVPPPTFLHSLAGSLPNAIPPIVFDFATIAKNNSLYNTLPVFSLYVATVVLQSLVRRFAGAKVAGQEEEAGLKAARIYAALDAHPDAYHVLPDRAVRSRMNICFRVLPAAAAADTTSTSAVGDADREAAFIKGAEARGLLGLKGHRSVGGIRVSNYNAVSVSAVDKLVAWIDEFATTQ
ncbi:hypothetical protein DV735_g1646, partial [Chaetothyriales sp. CBS 134920]